MSYIYDKKAIEHEVFGTHCCMAEGQETVSGRGRARDVQVSFL